MARGKRRAADVAAAVYRSDRWPRQLDELTIDQLVAFVRDVDDDIVHAEQTGATADVGALAAIRRGAVAHL